MSRPMIPTMWSVVTIAVVLASPVHGVAQAGRAEVEEGNRLYGEGRFGEAYEKYLEALREAPGSPLIRFNEGNALYRSEEVERALESYQAAIESGDPALQAAAWYNLGNALYRQQQLEQSLEAYKQALRMNPADTDAKHNLERVLEQMQQQEQEQEQEQQPGEGDENQDLQDQEQDPQQGEQPPGEQEQQPQEGQPRPREGDMSREEAERLLQAVQEDPGDVNRKAQVRGKRPKKKW